jgi:hypothetical protein
MFSEAGTTTALYGLRDRGQPAGRKIALRDAQGAGPARVMRL